jgi:hypothetical protein
MRAVIVIAREGRKVTASPTPDPVRQRDHLGRDWQEMTQRPPAARPPGVGVLDGYAVTVKVQGELLSVPR